VSVIPSSARLVLVPSLLAFASACLPPGTAVRPARVRVHEPAASAAAAAVATGTRVGAVLGGGLLALRHEDVGGAIGLTALGAWVGGVGAGQSVESSDPPMRWRTVHPPRAR
jgi:hypothetical protein